MKIEEDVMWITAPELPYLFVDFLQNICLFLGTVSGFKRNVFFSQILLKK